MYFAYVCVQIFQNKLDVYNQTKQDYVGNWILNR